MIETISIDVFSGIGAAAVGIAIAIVFLYCGFELLKYFKANRKYTNYLEAFKIAVLMKIAEDRKLPVEEYLIIEKEYKGLESTIKEKIAEYIEEGIQKQSKKATEKSEEKE